MMTARSTSRPDDVRGLRMPDAIAGFDTGGGTYFLTANEGDGRGNAGDLRDGDTARVGEIADGAIAGVVLDPAVDITGLERLTVSTIDGDTSATAISTRWTASADAASRSSPRTERWCSRAARSSSASSPR